MSDHVWPEDQGTNSNLDNLNSGDDNDAANHAAGLYNPNATDFVVSGLSLTYNSSDTSLDISAGKARVSDSNAEAAQSGETRDKVLYVVETDVRSGLSLTDNDVNHVYLDVKLAYDDDVDIVINTTGTQPSQPSLKIGEVDLT